MAENTSKIEGESMPRIIDGEVLIEVYLVAFLLPIAFPSPVAELIDRSL